MKKSILNWLDEQANQDNELTIVWEGGGDSGWVHFEIDGESVDNEYTEALVNHMYENLNYGSWAGEFQANGTAYYNSTTKSFEGTDYYGEDGNDVINVNIVIKVPKKIWFEILHVETESNYDETPNVSVRFIVRNGFLTQEHTDICSNLEEILRDEFEAVFNKHEASDNHEFRGCTDSWILERKDAIEEDDMLVFNITKIEIQTIDNEERNIVLELDEDTVEAIDNILNKKEYGN